MHAVRCLTLIAGIAFLALLPANAQGGYKLQPLVTAGDSVAGVTVSNLSLGLSLNDQGKYLFYGSNAAGGEALFLYDGSQFLPIVVGGGDAPGGKWPKAVVINQRPHLNQRGSFLFAAQVTIADKTNWGVFRWDGERKQSVAVAVVGMPATDSASFVPADGRAPTGGTINNREEFTFGAYIADAAGKSRRALFLHGQDRKLVPIILPDQVLPGGGTMVDHGGEGSFTDAGVVPFRARRSGDGAGSYGGYVWEGGTIAPVALVGQEVPGTGTIQHVTSMHANNQNRSLLVAARVKKDPDPARVVLLRYTDGKLMPLLLPGQELPGGGQFVSVIEAAGLSGTNTLGSVSPANGAGEHLVFLTATGNARGVYRLGADGKLSVVLRYGDTTELGRVVNITVDRTLALNSAGQIALMARIGNRREAIYLLTPSSP